MSAERKRRLLAALGGIRAILSADPRTERIILYGSMASGEVDEWSDLDLVIVQDTTDPFFQRVKEIALRCQSPVGTDYLVYTPNEFREMIREKNPFILGEVLAKGQILYERSHLPTLA